MAKLNAEQQEILDAFLDNDEGVAALYLAISQRIRAFEDELLQHHYIPGNEIALGYRKARLEGAQKLLADIKQLLRIK